MARIPASLLRLFAPLEALLSDPNLSQLVVDAPHHLWVERGRGRERLEFEYPQEQLRQGLEGLARRAGKSFNAERPSLEAMLRDGTRFLALREPISEGPILSIERPPSQHSSLEDLLQEGLLTPEIAELLRLLLMEGLNIALVGGSRAQRGRLLGALSGALPSSSRLALLDPQAWAPRGAHLRLSPLLTEEEAQISLSDLLYFSKQLCADRIVLGKTGPSDAWELLSFLAGRGCAVLLGLPGYTVMDGLSRLEALARAGAPEGQERACPGLLAAALDLVILLGERRGQLQLLGLEAIRASSTGLKREALLEGNMLLPAWSRWRHLWRLKEEPKVSAPQEKRAVPETIIAKIPEPLAPQKGASSPPKPSSKSQAPMTLQAVDSAEQPKREEEAPLPERLKSLSMPPSLSISDDPLEQLLWNLGEEELSEAEEITISEFVQIEPEASPEREQRSFSQIIRNIKGSEE